ncbi:MAG: hypothetical protein V2I33_19910 [Kangiellaceae bacterium]|jgi:hypothetical protein|nr:hypothetical protein [Kangiellaceae bacterium]
MGLIEKIETSSPYNHTYTYTQDDYYNFINNRFPGYFYNYRPWVKWYAEGEEKKFSDQGTKHIPLKDWDGIGLILNKGKEIVICNPDASVRLRVQVPDELPHKEEYFKRFNLSDSSIKEFHKNFILVFSRFDDYFEYEGKTYLTVLLDKYHKNHSDYSYQQFVYLDIDTGDFLPFTKELIRTIPNQYSYSTETVKLDQ